MMTYTRTRRHTFILRLAAVCCLALLSSACIAQKHVQSRAEQRAACYGPMCGPDPGERECTDELLDASSVVLVGRIRAVSKSAIKSIERPLRREAVSVIATNLECDVLYTIKGDSSVAPINVNFEAYRLPKKMALPGSVWVEIKFA